MSVMADSTDMTVMSVMSKLHQPYKWLSNPILSTMFIFTNINDHEKTYFTVKITNQVCGPGK